MIRRTPSIEVTEVSKTEDHALFAALSFKTGSVPKRSSGG
jgi:hypothetical protein